MTAPVRLRAAAAFAVGIAVVLAGLALVVHARVARDLGRAIDRELRARAQDLAPVAGRPGRALAPAASAGLVERGESFAQVLDADGRVADATPTVAGAPLLDAGERAAALRGPLFADRAAVPGLDEPARLLAVRLRGGRALLVVGTSAEDRAEALRSLRTTLLLALPAALALATLLGYLAVGSGLRSVEAMRARAAAITGEQPGARLPVPSTGDELQALAETLNAMLGRLDDALAREQAFVADAAHELRTPIALMRAELDLALEAPASEAELRETLTVISAETDRLAQLAGDLLLLASAAGGAPSLRREAVAADEALGAVARRFAVRARAEGRDLRAVPAPGVVLDADRVRVEQALAGLVDNALRHGAGDVRLTAVPVGDAVELAVGDGGPGIDPALRPRAFARFASGADDRAGAGLGLAIVAAIAEAHGGAAGARDRAGGGAEVWLRVPAWRGASIPAGP